jgi:hypothetical protein
MTKSKKAGTGSKTGRRAKIVKLRKSSNMTPLEFMLRVMNDSREPRKRRQAMAVAAAPYCHAKPKPIAPYQAHLPPATPQELDEMSLAEKQQEYARLRNLPLDEFRRESGHLLSRAE